jgi:hypothetical protein
MIRRCLIAVLLLLLPAFASAQTLNWTYPTGTAITGFNIWRGLGTGAPLVCGQTTKVNTQPIPPTTLTYKDTDPTIKPGQTYCYAVTAFSPTTESPPSNVMFYTPPLPPPTLVNITASVQFQGGGAGGTVVSLPAGIDTKGQAGSFVGQFQTGASVVLTATPKNNNSRFTGWTGACSGTAPTCTVVADVAKSVGATFVH